MIKNKHRRLRIKLKRIILLKIASINHIKAKRRVKEDEWREEYKIAVLWYVKDETEGNESWKQLFVNFL